MSFEEREHTADIIMHIRAPDIAGLFEDAGMALMTTMYRGNARPLNIKKIEISGPTPEHRLHLFLSELLYLSEVENMVFSEIKVVLSGEEISATLIGEPFNGEVHGGGTEVKGISWYGLSIINENNDYVCDVLFDV